MTESRGASDLGTIFFVNANALGYSTFANFLDDFNGPAAASTTRSFGVALALLNNTYPTNIPDTQREPGAVWPQTML